MLTVRFLFEEIIAHRIGICQEILEYFFVKLAYFYKKEEKKPKFTRILNSARRKYSFTQVLLGTKRTKKPAVFSTTGFCIYTCLDSVS